MSISPLGKENGGKPPPTLHDLDQDGLGVQVGLNREAFTTFEVQGFWFADSKPLSGKCHASSFQRDTVLVYTVILVVATFRGPSLRTRQRRMNSLARCGRAY